MAAPSNHASAVPTDTLITLKITLNGDLKKLKLPLRDLSAAVLPNKLRQCLNIKPEQTAVFERFSDSAGGFVTLDPTNPQVFKTLNRAAKAKLKLRLKATVTPAQPETKTPKAEKKEFKTIPTIVSSTNTEPAATSSPISTRSSAAVDGRSVGTGIFQFRDGLASQQTLVNTNEAPSSTPGPFHPTGIACNMPIRGRAAAPQAVNFGGQPWSVYCNECDSSMPDAHFHCGICDGGDFDLCEACVASGKLCPGEGHWLVKRSIKDGQVVSSLTERVSPRQSRPEPVVKQEVPGAYTDDSKTLTDVAAPLTRTCNNCVVVLPVREFVTCQSCDDFDLCIKCHTENAHGHHPAHGFAAATKDTVLALAAETMLAPGRNVRHNAICDGCDKKIYGVRHKCLNCPDWDYCNECIDIARISHPRHRFAPIYKPIADQQASQIRHFGIYCDGPLCKTKSNPSYIMGIRYKCAVCNDTDYCASCEALPSNTHNRTHPLIKFKTPVRGISVNTLNENVSGQVRVLGDRIAESANTSTAATANTASPVQTIAEIQPTNVKSATQPIPVVKPQIETVPVAAVDKSSELNAHFIQDTIRDSSVFEPGTRLTQIWTIRNPGPRAWPAGCSVRFVGGDNMFNLDNGHPASVADISDASESNVVGREVQVNEQVAFKVTLKAPSREGKCISYWRVKAADGTPFGHRLWCDIQVKRAEASEPALFSDLAHQYRAAQENAAFSNKNIPALVKMKQDAMLRQSQALQERANALGSRLQYDRPPAYQSPEDMSTRLAAMRAEQQKRREQIASQFQAQRKMESDQQLDRVHARQQIHKMWSPMDKYEGARNSTAPQQLPMGYGSFGFVAPFGSGAPDAALYAPASAQYAPPQSVGEDERVEIARAAKKRVEELKAKILKTREEREKALGTGQGDELIKSAESKPAAPQEEKKKEDSMEGSLMVFPKLDKESPSSSTYQSATSSSMKGKAAYVENEDGEVERAAEAPVVPAPISEASVSSPMEEEGYETLTDDLEVLSAEDSGSDDGFLTDEEYDILDASDHETIASP